MAVKITTDCGICTRRRTADINEYVLQGDGKQKLFEAVNKDVPEDIQKFFRLSDVNVQQQHDAPFLLSASASDVAKYFNRIVRLDVIDVVLGNAESKRRDTNKKIKETENEKKNLEKQLEGYKWIETAQEMAERLLKIDERIKIYSADCNETVIDIETYKVQKEFLSDFPDIKKAGIYIDEIEKIKIDYDTPESVQKTG